MTGRSRSGNARTGEELLTLEGFRGPIWLLRFSPDGHALATFSGTGVDNPGEIRLWIAAEDEPYSTEGARSQARAFAN